MTTEIDRSSAVFDDARGKRIVFLSHCILNQNARIATCAFTPATVPSVAEFFIEQGIGMVQGVCPEFEILGLGRRGQVADQLGGGYQHEDGEIYDQLSVPDNRAQLKGFAEALVARAKHYIDNGFEIIGILGIAGSPACGVNITYYGRMKEGRGAYIEELAEALSNAGLEIPIVEINDLDPDGNMVRLRELVA